SVLPPSLYRLFSNKQRRAFVQAQLTTARGARDRSLPETRTRARIRESLRRSGPGDRNNSPIECARLLSEGLLFRRCNAPEGRLLFGLLLQRAHNRREV